MSSRPRWLLLGLAFVALPAGSAAAQTGDPPCGPGVAPAATIRGIDMEGGGGPLTATHTIALELESGDEPIQDFTVELPPGAEPRRVGPSPGFRVDAPGPVPVTARWSHFDAASGSSCTASAEATLNIDAARPLRFIPATPRRGRISTLDWRVRIGRNADLRPVEMRLRGVRRARLPRPSTPLKTLTFALRRGDPGLWSGRPERVLRSAGWRFAAGFNEENEIFITMRTFRGRRRGFGFDFELLQAGRRIGRARGVGRCGYLLCDYRTVR
jgi:hypothetical protein